MTDTIQQQNDEPRFTATQIINVLNHLGTLDAVTLVQNGYVDVSKVLADISPKTFSVVLGDVGDKKISVIKIIREHNFDSQGVAGVGLAEAKQMTDEASGSSPVTVLTTDDESTAMRMLRELGAAGATAEVQEHQDI